MRIFELLEANQKINFLPATDIEGRPVELTPIQVQQIVKANALTTSIDAQRELGKGRIPMPVVVKSGSTYQVVRGGEFLASLTNSPQKVRVMVQDPKQFAQQQAQAAAQVQAPASGQAQPAAANAASSQARDTTGKFKGPGVATQVQRGYRSGSYAAKNLGYTLSSIPSKFGAR